MTDSSKQPTRRETLVFLYQCLKIGLMFTAATFWAVIGVKKDSVWYFFGTVFFFTFSIVLTMLLAYEGLPDSWTITTQRPETIEGEVRKP
jgi:hypothetical protein